MTNLLDKNILTRIEEFKNKISSSGSICKQDVLSLEDFVGAAVITEKRDIKRYTDIPTSIGVNETIEIVNEVIKSVDIVAEITYKDVVEQILEVSDKLKKIVNKVISLKSIKPEVLDRLVNEKYIWYYKNYEDDSSVNDIYDISKENIVHTLRWRNDYLSSVLSNSSSNHVDTFNSIKYLVNELDLIKDEDITVVPLLSTIFNKELGNVFWNTNINIDEVTIYKVYLGCSDIDNIIESLKDILSSVEVDRAEIRDNHKWFIYNERQNILKLYNRYKNFNSFISHKPSNIILNIISLLKEV